jgi:hypothetical protein
MPIEQRYAFSDFDREVFTNHETNKVELVYPTPLIASIPDNTVITIKKYDLERLVYPALTRIVYKKQSLLLRHANSLDCLAETPEQKEQVKKHRETEKSHSAYLNQVYDTVKTGLESLSGNDTADRTITEKDFILLVQYAAYTIEHYEIQSAVVVGDQNKLFFYDEPRHLLQKYRIHEQKQ